MKQVALSREKMEHLEGLGLDISDASMAWMENTLSDGEYYLDLVNRDVINFYCYAYTLDDIMSKLPERIIKDKTEYTLVTFYNTHIICYCDFDNFTGWAINFIAPNKNYLGAAYNMLCWCIENKYIKTK